MATNYGAGQGGRRRRQRTPLPHPLRRYALTLLRERTSRLRGHGQQRAHPDLARFTQSRGASGEGVVPGAGTSIGGAGGGVSCGAGVGCPGCEGSAAAVRRFWWLLLHDRSFRTSQRGETLAVAPAVILAIAPLLVRARGGTGRRAGFRFQCRKTWGFDSLRAHQRLAASGDDNDF